MIKRLLAFAALVLSLNAHAQSGVFELPTPLPTEGSGKIEVMEFFWYGCPHCYALDPVIQSWSQKLPNDVQFKRMPAMFNNQWAQAGRVFFTLESLGVLDSVHTKLFDAIHQQHLRITDQAQLSNWLSRQGVDVQKYSAAQNSFTVESKLKRAAALTRAAQPHFNGVPAIVVGGRYLVTTEAGPPDRMLAVVNDLIARMRSAAAPASGK